MFSTELKGALLSLSKKQRILLVFFLTLSFAGLLGTVGAGNYYLSVSAAAAGGELTEGIIGSPRFINPLLALSDADRDLTALIYSGLLRVAADGELFPDLAENLTVSADDLIYTLTLKDNLSFHDGEPLTADDVEFTVQKAKDSLIKSPKRAAFEGVTVEKIDRQTIRFVLKQPYAPFPENLTLGILPKHLWQSFDPEAFSLNQFNTEPVGSGPYKIRRIKKNSLGVPQTYELSSFPKFALGRPKIDRLTLKLFPGETDLLNAYRRQEIESVAALPAETIKALENEGARVIKVPLPRIFGLFFNPNKSEVLAHKEVRQALDLAIDRQALVDSVLHGYGLSAFGPLPVSPAPTDRPADGIEAARQLLAAKGWNLNEEENALELELGKEKLPLTFSLSTADTKELKAAAESLKNDLERLGARVNLQIFEIGDLNQNVIRTREYEALFFGEVVGPRPDLFSFWHSSQRLDPGLNIALYANIAVDKILDQLRRATGNREQNQELYRAFEKEIAQDVPAVFVYSPFFLYLLPPKVLNVSLPPINTAADRFLNIHEWHIATERVWRAFAPQT